MTAKACAAQTKRPRWMRPIAREPGASRGLTCVDASDANVVRFTRGRVSVVRPTTGPSKVRGIYESTWGPSRKTAPPNGLGADFNPRRFLVRGQEITRTTREFRQLSIAPS